MILDQPLYIRQNGNAYQFQVECLKPIEQTSNVYEFLVNEIEDADGNKTFQDTLFLLYDEKSQEVEYNPKTQVNQMLLQAILEAIERRRHIWYKYWLPSEK